MLRCEGAQPAHHRLGGCVGSVHTAAGTDRSRTGHKLWNRYLSQEEAGTSRNGGSAERRAQGAVRRGDGEEALPAAAGSSGPAHHRKFLAPPTAGSARPRPPPEPFFAAAGDAFRAVKMAAPAGRCLWRGRAVCWVPLFAAWGRRPAPLRPRAAVSPSAAGGRCGPAGGVWGG